MSQNPLLIKSAMPFKAVPLDQIKPEHFLPALEERIEQARQRLDRIRTATDKPTFENTILEFERAGEEVESVWGGARAFHKEYESFYRDQARAAAASSQGDEKAEPFVLQTPRVGRNEPCPCGSGKKFKQCCGRNAEGARR